MTTLYVKTNSMEQIKDLVHRVDKYDFSVDAYCGSYVVDAKSILGMVNIGFDKELKLVAYTNDVTMIEKDLSDYIVEMATAV